MTATDMVQDVFDFLDGIEAEVEHTAKEQEVSKLMLWMLIKQKAECCLEEITGPKPK